MCGIAVTLDLRGSGRASPWALASMRHRGPDGEGVAEDLSRNIVLESCRLAIIDPDNPEADQPFTDPTGRWTIVYNGEIFNFRELRREFERAGVEFRTNSDTEVLLVGFVHEGARILERLRGMFAFVVWDRETGEVFAARDQIGVKPLYYFVNNGVFAACSEIRPLLAHPSFRPALDPVGVVEFLAFGNTIGDLTPVEGVRALLPGHYLRIRAGRVHIIEYWDVLPPEPDEVSGSHVPSELLERLDDAVDASLVSDVPVGLMLSGGIDSSAIAALAVRHVRPSELMAYSVEFGLPDDEAEAAGRLARDLGVSHRVIRVTDEEVRQDFDAWLADLDLPTGNPTWIATSFIARAARDDGIKVLLSGDGGDELFGGYNRWMKYLRFHDRFWARVPPRGRRLLGRVSKRATGGLAGDIARRASGGGELFVPSRPCHDDDLERCLGPVGLTALAARHPESRVQDLRRSFDERLPAGDYLAWMSYAAFKTSLVGDFLTRLDRMGMRHSIEGRVPLLDPTLVRWSFGIPQRVKVPRWRQKALLRTAVEPVLPRYVVTRPKLGFCAPVAGWSEALLLGRPVPADNPLFESGLIRRDAFEFLSLQSSGNGFASWTLALLAEWTARNVASAAPADIEVAVR